ncbi:MAG: glycoside hydrolase family 2 [Bacteroidales bacterium]|nr:glycoside hydrolase family 2 [Bacteroidales bacterium]
MKTLKHIWILILAAVLCSCAQNASLSNGSVLVLGDGWRLSHTGGTENVPAVVPSTVAGTLYASGAFGENLLEGQNYKNVDKSIFDDEWVYKTRFAARPGEGQHCELVFDGIDYRADIVLNGKQIASSETTFGVFRRQVFDVTELLRRNNTLEVKLHRAQKGDLNLGFVDWNPRPLDESMGLVRPVTLHTTGAVSIEDIFVIPDLDVATLAQADLEVRVKLRNREDRPVQADLALDLQEVGTFSVPVELAAGETKTVSLTPAVDARLHIDNPRVWWSYDLGTPELYDISACAVVDGTVSDERGTTFGIRRIESRLTDKNYRQFTLNGKDILIKGAGWTDDIFLLDTLESLAQQVQYVKDMNLNLIRFENIWGKDDTIYDLCDREGVLALVGWSCQWEWEDYCGLPETRGYGCINGKAVEDLAVDYFRDQVVRLHNHASVIGWMTGSDRIPNPVLEQRYMEIYRAEEYRPYICSAKCLESSVTGWSGTKMEGPYEYVAPDYWYLDTQYGGAFGFNTETGIGANMPQLESLQKMIPENERWPLSDTWNYHCTASSSCMNNLDMLLTAITERYGAPTSLTDFVRKAHAIDYSATAAMFESFRVRIPNATGIVQWMLNSAWPSLYWQLYDWYGVPTAGYYGTKKACEPEQMIYNYGDRKVYVVSERPEGRTLQATLQVYDENSKLVEKAQRTVKDGYRTVTPVFDLHRHAGKAHFVFLSLTTEDGTPVADNFYCIAAKNNDYIFDKSTWYYTPVASWSDLRFAFAQDEADVAVSVVPTEDGYSVTLENLSPVVASMNVLKALDKDGNLAVPAYWSENFFGLAPGQVKTVTCKTAQKDLDIILEH